jgi:hypothetical protein
MEAGMNDAAVSYENLEARILRGRALGILPEETEDVILEEMDDLWLAMSEEERAAANTRTAETTKVSAPESLNLKDIPLSEGTCQLPREAA